MLDRERNGPFILCSASEASDRPGTWTSLTWTIPRSDYRVLVGPGRLVYAYAVVGQLTLDGAVELLEIDIDLPSPSA